MECPWHDNSILIKGETRIEKYQKTIILAVAVATLVALLMAGCQQSDQKEPAKTLIQNGKEQTDSLKKDSVETFDEQMRRWHVLHGGMSRWESDK